MARGTRLTLGMIDVLITVRAEAEAGGFEVHIEGMTDKEQKRFFKDADKVEDWLHEQRNKRLQRREKK